IARKLKISASVVSKWRCELVEQGLLPENEKITSVDVEDWTPEVIFSFSGKSPCSTNSHLHFDTTEALIFSLRAI
ncbi:hypothetical protein QJA11_27100, partial [Escherichia coli]